MSYPGWVKRDLDGFFGLFLDNLIQLMLIVTLCTGLLGFPAELVLGKILPGAALSILLGNIAYFFQARRLVLKNRREDVTALPYGINTVSLFGYVFFVMLPVVQSTHDPLLAWRVGLVACLGSALIERKFLAAAAWMFACSLFAWVGLIHAPLRWGAAPTFTVAYAALGILCLLATRLKYTSGKIHPISVFYD